MADKVSYFSRFTAKFIEIIAAGVATAVSGYLVAHLGGYLSTPAPTAAPPPVEVAPRADRVPGIPPAHPVPPPSAAPLQRSSARAAQSATMTTGGIRTAPATRHAAVGKRSVEAIPNEPVVKIKRREADVAEPRGIVEAKRRAGAEAKRRKAAEAKRRAAAAASRRSAESVEAEVRAALAKVGASRRSSPDALSLQTQIPPEPPRVETPSRINAPGLTGTIPAPARAADDGAPPRPRTADSAPQPAPAPLQSAPLATVEIKSLPIAAVGTTRSPSPAAQGNVSPENVSPENVSPENVSPENVSQANAPQASASKQKAQSRSTGLFSAIEKIPDLLRSDPPVPADQAPRPPLPVGQ